MGAAKTNTLSDPSYAIRPALAEAKLLTDKHACDTVYVVTLCEELRNVEAMIAKMEQDLRLGASVSAAQDPLPQPFTEQSGANWIRTKSSELDRRLRRIEDLAPAASHRSSTRNSAEPRLVKMATSTS